MTPDQSFARWVKISLAAFAVLFVYYLLADIYMPVTPQSRVIHPVIKVAPRVTGTIVEVNVANNQHVQAGDVLFSLDPLPYQLAVEQAELSLESVHQQNAELDASIQQAQQQVELAKVTLANLQRERDRLEPLSRQNSVSRQAYDDAVTAHEQGLVSLHAQQANLQKLMVERGDKGDSNLALRQARNKLEQAKLNLSYTQVKAQASGVVSNLQLTPGTYASAGNPLAALVTDKAELVADFREKSLSKLRLGSDASVVFDALPGEVFTAKVTALDAGTTDGQLNADGNLAVPDVTDRWVRSAQRQRVHLQLLETPEHPLGLPSGARATVQLHHTDGMFAWLGKMQIELISLIHFIY